ncbi:MAG: carboxypeptidase-like regulatory domain-containing protein [Polyangiaceae bacterium]
MKLRRHHPSRHWLTAAFLCSGALQAASIGVAHAEEDTATETGAARTLAVDGLKLAQAGRCEEAVPKLERAEKLHHSAIVLSRLGECEVSMGKLVEGTEMLRKVLREQLPANPTPALSKAYERAQTVLDAAKPRIAGLTVSVPSPPPDLRLTVDGQAVATTLVDSELPADPGDHVIEASAPGFLKATAKVTLGSADKRTVVLKLEVDPNAPPPAIASASQDVNAAPAPRVAPTRAAAAPSVPPAEPPAAPSHAAAYVSWGVGLVGVGVGTAFGVMTLKDKHNLQCDGNSCPASQRDAVDSAKRSGNISTIAFGAGGAGLLLGTILYFSLGSSSAETQANTPSRGFAGLHNGRAAIGPGSVQLAADF